jgi:hypothetical protein
MGTERDRAGTPGAGLSGAGRGPEGTRPAMPGSPVMGDPGTAEVRSGLHSGGTGDAYSGLGFADTATGARARTADEEASSRAGKLGGRAREVAEDLGHRASDAASTARERVSGLRERTNRVLERRGLVDRLRDNPLPVLGVAFAVGFLVAGSDDRNSDSRAARARRELRSALMAGLSAGLAQGARSFLSEAGNEGSGFLNSLLDNLAGDAGERSGSRDAFASASRGRGASYGGSTGGPSYARGGGARPSRDRETF